MGCVQTKKSSNINIDEFNNNIETLYEFSHGLEELDDVIEYDGNPIKLNYKIENTGKELNLARDMFLLSFYLCGINLKDLLSVHFDNSNYLSFERSKTSRSKRGDSRLTIPIHAVAAQIHKQRNEENEKILRDKFHSLFLFRQKNLRPIRL